MDLEEDLGQVFVGGYVRIENDGDSFGMAGRMRFDGLVGRTLQMATNVTAGHRQDAWLLLHQVLHPPKTASGKNGGFQALQGSQRQCGKFQRDRIDTMPGIGRRESFPFKDMSQVTATISTDVLRTTAIGIGLSFDSTWQGFVKTGPATTGIKLIIRSIQRRVALFAQIGTLLVKVLIYATVRPFRTFVKYDGFFLRC